MTRVCRTSRTSRNAVDAVVAANRQNWPCVALPCLSLPQAVQTPWRRQKGISTGIVAILADNKSSATYATAIATLSGIEPTVWELTPLAGFFVAARHESGRGGYISTNERQNNSACAP
jgi:hypothetical protein